MNEILQYGFGFRPIKVQQCLVLSCSSVVFRKNLENSNHNRLPKGHCDRFVLIAIYQKARTVYRLELRVSRTNVLNGHGRTDRRPIICPKPNNGLPTTMRFHATVCQRRHPFLCRCCIFDLLTGRTTVS